MVIIKGLEGVEADDTAGIPEPVASKTTIPEAIIEELEKQQDRWLGEVRKAVYKWL